MDLKKCREEIDRIDDQLLDLFLRRMEVSREVAAYKRANGLPTYSAAREQEILDKRTAQAGPEMAPYVSGLYNELFSLSKQLQEKENSMAARKKPVLVILAAGMGSRYGGLKQMDPIGSNGEVIIDFSLYDAMKAGFETVVCIIKREIEEDFRRMMDAGAARKLNVLYAFQEKDDLPEGYSVPEGRTKPWGTGHAILAARELVDAPFAIINADDYYGPEAFKTMYDYLSSAEDGEKYDYSMVGYYIQNTLSDNGGVTRGVCLGKDGYLKKIRETSGIERKADGVIRYPDGDGEGEIADGTLVSMNMFGFTPSIMKELWERFPKALDSILADKPLKGEFFIPAVVGELVEEGRARVRILSSSDRWYGVTYHEDREVVVKAMQSKKDQGIYPEKLWE